MKWLTQWAITSSALILIVLAARFFFRDKLSARLRYALWAVVLLRLLAPFQIELPAPVSPPVLASNLVPELPSALERPLSPDTATTHTRIPEEYFTADHNQTPDGEPTFSFTAADLLVFDSKDGYVHLYQGGFTLGDTVAALWLAGAGLAGAVMLWSNLRFYVRLRRRRERLAHTDAPIPVYAAEGLPSPCLFGVLRPAVYVTPEAAERPDILRHVLAHELTHRAHLDHIWSLLRCLALALHWYNPLVWLAVGLSKKDGELACDEGAIARLGEEERVPYGRTLVDMVARRSLRPADLLSCSTAMTGGKKSIQQRVAQLVKKPETVKTALFAAVAVVVLAVVFVFAGRGPSGENAALAEFQSCVDSAVSIWYAPPAYSSTFYPYPITDQDPLAQAKKALSGFEPLPLDDPGPKRNTLMHASTMRLTLEDGEEADYTLLRQDGCTYVFAGAVPWWEEETSGDPWYSEVFRTEQDVISILERLARMQTSPDTGSPELDRFLAQADSAVSIQLGLPLYSSQSPPGPITDPELLALAKNSLSGFEPMGEDWIGPGRSKLIEPYRVILSDGETEHTYALVLGNDSRTYLYLWEGIAAGLGSETETPKAIARMNSNVINSLSSYAAMQRQRDWDPNYFIPMTQEEYQAYTPEFLQEKGIARLQGWGGRLEDVRFYTVGYKARDYIQLRYFGDKEHDGTWVLVLGKLPSLDSNRPPDPDEVPIGYTVLADQPLEVFAAEWYAGQLEGDALFYDMMGPDMCAARLQPEDVTDAWLLQGDAVLGSVSPNLETLKGLMIQSLYHQFSAEYDGKKHGQHTLTLQWEDKGDSYLGHELADSANQLNLSIGTEKDVVCLWKTAFAVNGAPQHTFVRSPELYRAIRNLYEAAENHAATSKILVKALESCSSICFEDSSEPAITDPELLAQAKEILTSGYLIDDMEQSKPGGDHERISIRYNDGRGMMTSLITNRSIRQQLHELAQSRVYLGTATLQAPVSVNPPLP